MMKWRSASGVLCGRKLNFFSFFYKTAIRPAMLYGPKC